MGNDKCFFSVRLPYEILLQNGPHYYIQISYLVTYRLYTNACQIQSILCVYALCPMGTGPLADHGE